MRTLVSCLFIAVVLATSASAALAYARPSAAPTLVHGARAAVPEGQYLFVELWVQVDGTGTLPALCVDFPQYEFNSRSGTLTPFFGELPPLAAGDIGFVGDGTSRRNAASCGASSSLQAVTGLPYATSIGVFTGTVSGYHEALIQVPATLDTVAADGTLTATIGGVQVVLAPGQVWAQVGTGDLVSGPYTGSYHVRSSLTNYGWRNRALIERPIRSVWWPVGMKGSRDGK